MKKLLPLFLFLLFALPLAGQTTNIRWDATASTTNGSGTLVPVLAVPGSTVAFYNACTTSPCNPTRAATFTSASSTTQCPSSQQVVLQLPFNQACTSFADVRGNFGAYFQPGAYLYTYTAGGLTYGPFAFNVGGGGGGGGVTPSSPANSIQVANTGLNGLASDPNLLINPTTHTFSDTANMRINAMESAPRIVYDPMDTKYDGGLAAAQAGTSGFTPTQVIQATVDYAECQFQMHLAAFPGRIALPSGTTFGITQILLWNSQELSGESLVNHPTLQHISNAAAMIATHGTGDTITCSNGTTYTPSAAGSGGQLVQNLAIAGMGLGAGSGTGDIGILENAEGMTVYNITGAGNAFASEAIKDAGFANFTYRVGYPLAQLNGCYSFVISGALTGNCDTVEIDSVDSELDYVYATNGGFDFNANHNPGHCYPNCAAVGVNGANDRVTNVFAQLSDVGVLITGENVRGNTFRVDASSREGVRITANGNDVLNDFQIIAPCTDAALQSNFNSGIATGCSMLLNTGTGSQISSIAGGGNAFFGNSYIECFVNDGVSGSSAVANTYGFVEAQGNPNNATANGNGFCGQSSGDASSGRILLPSMGPQPATTATANVSGVSNLVIGTTPLTNMTSGYAGQEVTITGVTGSSVVSSADLGTGNITTCSHGPETGISVYPITFKNVGGYHNTGGVSPNNIWREVCNTPNPTPWHVNYAGNPAPSNPSFLSVLGNVQALQTPIPGIDVTQLHGPTTSGSACFEQQFTFPDGSQVVTALGCTTVNLATMTPGAIFVSSVVNAASANLYLVSNTQGNGVATGKYPPPTSGFWLNTVIAAGGDGTTPPAASDNSTGEHLAPFGVRINTTTTQPACTVEYQGVQWIVRNATTGDVYQICQQQSGGAFAWVTH